MLLSSAASAAATSKADRISLVHEVLMENPKTTMPGVLGALGGILLALGTAFQSKPWAQTLMVVGAILTGSNGIGSYYAPSESVKATRKHAKAS